MKLNQDVISIIYSYNGKPNDKTIFLCDFYDNIYNNIMQHEGLNFTKDKLDAIYIKSLPCPFDYMIPKNKLVKKWWNSIKDAHFLKLAKDEFYDLEVFDKEKGMNIFMNYFEEILHLKVSRKLRDFHFS